MQVKSFDSLTLASNNLVGHVNADGSDDGTAEYEYLMRAGGEPAFAVGRGQTRLMKVVITTTTPASWTTQRAAILRALDWPVSVARKQMTVVTSGGDADVLVTVKSVILRDAAMRVEALVEATTAAFVKQGIASDGPTAISSNTSRTLTNNGHMRVYPIIRVNWGAQRVTETAAVGWKRRKTVSVGNTGTRNWRNEPIAIDLGDTASLVSGGKALSSGNDVRVRVQGVELPRTLQGWNTAQTFVVFPLSLSAGQTVTVEIVYSNPAAGTPKNFSSFGGSDLRTYCAADLTSDSGTATSGALSTLTDSGKAWVTDEWKGGFIRLTGGTGGATHAVRRVLSNTATTITVDRNFTSAPASGTTYTLWTSGCVRMGGAVSSATSTVLTDSSAAFNTNEFVKGGTVTIVSGTGSGATEYAITAMTATTITTSGTFPTLDTTSRYVIKRHGYRLYYVDQTNHAKNHRGGWRMNSRSSQPSKIWFANQGISAAWDRALYLANDDDFRQTRFAYLDDGTGDDDPFPILDALRRRGSDSYLTDKRQYDGVSLYSACGFSGHHFDFQIKMPKANGKFIVATRDEGGEDWEDRYTYGTLQANWTAVAATFKDLSDSLPVEIYHGVVPADRIAYPGTEKLPNSIQARWYKTLRVLTDQTYVSIGTLGAEESIYDLQVQFGNRSLISTSTQKIVVGGPDHYLHLASGDVLVVDCVNGRSYTFGGLIDDVVTSYTPVPWAAVVSEGIDDPAGTGGLIYVPSREWMPLLGGSNTFRIEETAMGTLNVYVLWNEKYLL